MRICRASARLYGNEQSLDLRNIRKLSSERFNQGVFDGELVMGGLPQFLDRLDVSMISIGTAGEGDCLADSCRDNLANELAHIILIGGRIVAPRVEGAVS